LQALPQVPMRASIFASSSARAAVEPAKPTSAAMQALAKAEDTFMI
jgi:hypothetical protein